MVYDTTWLHDNPYWSYDDAIRTIWDEYPTAWAKYWGIDHPHAPDHLEPDEWEAAKRLHAHARRLTGAALALSGRKLPEQMRTLPEALRREERSEKEAMEEWLQQIRESLDPDERESDRWGRIFTELRQTPQESESRRMIFDAAMQLHAAEQFMLSPRVIAERTVKLLDYLVTARGERTAEYLGRVATCYIRGMAPELAVMSRAVLEAALEDYNLEARVRRNLNASPAVELRPKLTDLIQAAADEGLLDQDRMLLAGELREHGNKAIHVVPNDAPDPDVTMQRLVEVLSQLDERGHNRASR